MQETVTFRIFNVDIRLTLKTTSYNYETFTLKTTSYIIIAKSRNNNIKLQPKYSRPTSQSKRILQYIQLSRKITDFPEPRSRMKPYQYQHSLNIPSIYTAVYGEVSKLNIYTGPGPKFKYTTGVAILFWEY